VLHHHSTLLIVFVGMFNVGAADIDFGPAPGSPLKLAGGGQSFVMGDVNRDGKPDVIVCGDSTRSSGRESAQTISFHMRVWNSAQGWKNDPTHVGCYVRSVAADVSPLHLHFAR
jgi:hypothetical protein